MKENFLINWVGANHFGQPNKWSRAQGSSLKPGDWKILESGGIVKHPKGNYLTKVFVKDENGQLWSVIVRNVLLETLEKDLENVGYLLPAA